MDNTIENNILTKENSENVVVDGNISMSEKEIKRQTSNNNLKPFRAYSELTPEEQERQRNISILGGKARSEQLQRHKTMKESAKVLLGQKVSREYAESVLGKNSDVSEIDTWQDLIVAKMLREVVENGNAKAFELIRDTSGNKPTAEVDIRADIVTASDKALIDKVADRLGIVDITPDDDNENG